MTTIVFGWIEYVVQSVDSIIKYEIHMPHI
jgi:hypothetical protein